ncbi:hypothetical protein CH267_13225 [Rhodococcus sp. 06-621-2]|nr:TIGR00366 family protein [Rhodococcus sp. 06-621-2]OZC55530.1 hypothetical protein CH267_13225 [Rhodococcus sp. 06-621-2]
MTTVTRRNRIRPIQRLADRFSTLCERWVPDPWVIVVLLTAIASVLAFFLTPGALGGNKVVGIVTGWGEGFWGLLEFTAQMAFVLVSGFIVASAPPMQKFLRWVASRDLGPRQTVAMTALVSLGLVWVHWGLGVVAAGMLVRYFAAHGTKADYRLLVAAAYLGMAGTVSSGLASSTGLLLATPGSFAAPFFGVIPMTDTIFTPFNLILVGVLAAAWTVTAFVMHPSPAETVQPTDDVREKIVNELEDGTAERSIVTPVDRIENSRWVNYCAALLGFAYLAIYFTQLDGNLLAGITLNTVNLLFLFIGIVLHRTPRSLLKAAQTGGTFVWGILLQFPFYAGILGIFVASGLGEQIASWFEAIATTHTFPVIAYLYSGVMNFFVPSGGALFAIQAPYLAETANRLDVPLDLTAVAYMWGDMTTNTMQPFWALPLLAMCGLTFRSIMGFLVVFGLIGLTLCSAAFLIAPHFF